MNDAPLRNIIEKLLEDIRHRSLSGQDYASGNRERNSLGTDAQPLKRLEQYCHAHTCLHRKGLKFGSRSRKVPLTAQACQIWGHPAFRE
jgi:hypothetical protein